MRNVFKDLSDLPDKPRLGVNLMGVGLAVGILRFVWPRAAPESYQSTSGWFASVEPYLSNRSPHPALPGDFGLMFLGIGMLFFISGAFIFSRRGFWWVSEHRADDKSVTQLDLK
jgi:hypothetical protein